MTVTRTCLHYSCTYLVQVDEMGHTEVVAPRGLWFSRGIVVARFVTEAVFDATPVRLLLCDAQLASKGENLEAQLGADTRLGLARREFHLPTIELASIVRIRVPAAVTNGPKRP